MTRPTILPVTAALSVLLALILVAASPLSAQSGTDSKWSVRASVAGIYPTGSVVNAEVPAGKTTFDVSSGTGFGLDLSYRLSRRVSLQAGLLVGDVDAELGLEPPTAARLKDTETVSTETFSLGADFHLTPDRRTDFYIGALVAMSTFDGVTFLTEEGLREKRPFDDDVGFGAQAGVEFPLGSSDRWSLGLRLRYLLVIMEAESDSGGRDYDFDPFVPSLGISYRF